MRTDGDLAEFLATLECKVAVVAGCAKEYIYIAWEHVDVRV